DPFAEGEPPSGSAADPRVADQEAWTPATVTSARRRPPARLLLLVAVAVVGAVVAVIVNSRGGSGAGDPFRLTGVMRLPQSPVTGGRPFTTVTPAQWRISMTLPYPGVTDYQLTSSGSSITGGEVLPPPGTIEIQIEDFTPASVETFVGPRAGTQSPIRLLRYQHEPRGASDVVRSVAPHGLSLGGVAAAGQSYTYAYAGRRDVQTELVSRRAGDIVSIEVDSGPSLKASAASALSTIVANWHWLSRSEQAPPAQTPPVAVAPTGPLPQGQWIASGFTDAVTGGVANARLDQHDVRAWDFTQACTTATRCHTDLVEQLSDGATGAPSRVVQIPGNSWWEAQSPATGGFCALEASRPIRRETIRDTLRLAWMSPAHRELTGEQTETITGCADVLPAEVSYHWTATAVPRVAIPQITLNPRHAPSASAFRSAATRVCTGVNARASQLVLRIERAAGLTRTAPGPIAKAAAEASIATQLEPIVRLWVEEYTQIPQPPAGPLDVLWLRDLNDNRQQIVPAAAAISALQAAVLATSRFLRSDSPVALQTAVSEGTLFAEDQAESEGPAKASKAIERELRLPAICISPPAFKSVSTARVVA
ncbi:MAG: hypothetical protein WAK40_05870, partial [Thermoplasmata archaeon]